MGIKLKVLDPTENCPAASVAEHVLGDFSDFDTVKCAFGSFWSAFLLVWRARGHVQQATICSQE